MKIKKQSRIQKEKTIEGMQKSPEPHTGEAAMNQQIKK